MLSFRRNFSPHLTSQWHDLEAISSSIVYQDNPDSLIWQYENSGVYSTSSLYVIINFGGVVPVFIPAIWKLHTTTHSPRVHIFLWLLPHDKILTRDSLKKRHMHKPEDCFFFCSALESVHGVFFDCVVAKQIWSVVSAFFWQESRSRLPFYCQKLDC